MEISGPKLLYLVLLITVLGIINYSQFSFHSVTAVLTPVQTEQIIYVNESIQNTVNTSTHITKTPTLYKMHTHTHTHTHVKKQI
jgi:3-methyladenine DNA glycosylase AlkC